ncbi:MAG: hypothetical protein C0501_15950 [Isosphaera sp.]|nr:hypothetical protein [Isosphaera sp.]
MTETVPAPGEEALTTAEVVARLQELGARYPAPTWDDVMPDWKWVNGRGEDRTLDPDGRYADRWVAVLNEKIVGYACDPAVLRLALAREYGIHPERFVVTYVHSEW